MSFDLSARRKLNAKRVGFNCFSAVSVTVLPSSGKVRTTESKNQQLEAKFTILGGVKVKRIVF